jgi:hypothetical protein
LAVVFGSDDDSNSQLHAKNLVAVLKAQKRKNARRLEAWEQRGHTNEACLRRLNIEPAKAGFVRIASPLQGVRYQGMLMIKQGRQTCLSIYVPSAPMNTIPK